MMQALVPVVTSRKRTTSRKRMRRQRKRQWRMRESGCFICGVEDHWAKDCHKRNYERKDFQEGN